MKKIKCIATILIALIIGISYSNTLYAEVGNSGGFDSGGGGGGGGGGWSSGGSDWGGSSGGSGGSNIDIGGFMFCAVIVIAFSIFSSSKKKTTKSSVSRSVFSTSIVDEEATLKQIKEQIPIFDEAEFKSFVSDVYMQVQGAWQAKDWKQIRLVESNELFNQHSRQLKEYIDYKKTNYLKSQRIHSVELAEYRLGSEQETIMVRLNASLYDYTLDDASGRLIEGSKTNIQKRSYCLLFTRSIVRKDEALVHATQCPNCGADLSILQSGECEYCHSIIVNGSYGWALTRYCAWKQR